MKLVKDTQFYKTLFIIALPAAFQSLISLGVNMLDNIMVGSLGDVPLAAVSLCNQVTTLLAFFIKGISGGSAVLISQYWGKRIWSGLNSSLPLSFVLVCCAPAWSRR